ncbi:lipopolysaccharide assembly protein LapB [Herminiimonas sp.]|uniref:tetratricopeptide repeat protein n=1 Tax=Herminiimonas sp. TaxID=1926289 RepID=UPI00271B8EBB|nr:tetratricopeptide repeat protein [Herminiimonas sp.]MDO8305149.1 tetratricopeptide repeat protein [Herminiimonas sp.]
MTRPVPARGLAAGLCLTALLAGSASAQTTPDKPDLYQEALQSIAEGRKNDASAALMRVIENEPLHAGAWLEIALIQCSLGHADEADRLFRDIIERFKPPQGILDLISEARAGGCNSWHANSQGSLMVARGIDQNVNQGASTSTYAVIRDGIPLEEILSPDFLPRHDQYSVFGGEYMRDITPNGSIAFGQFQARRNDSLSQYDSASLFVGVETPWRLGRWTLRSTSMLGLTSLGGALYQRHVQFQARVGPPIALPGKTQLHLIAAYSHVDYRTLVSFDSNTVELKAQLSYRSNGSSASLTSGYLNDHATGDRAGGDRHGWLHSLLVRQALPEGMMTEVGLVRQSWHSALPYAPAIPVVRDQRTQVIRATLIMPVGKNHNVQLEARQVRNKENISVFQYNNRLLQLSWQWNGL